MSSVDFYYDDSDIDDSSDENSISLIRKNIRDNTNPLALNSQTFVQNFRLSKEAFVDLLEEIDDKFKPIMRQRAIPNIIKLAAVLRFCAQGSYQNSVGNDFNLGLAQSTVSVIFKEVFNVLETHICPKWIKFDYTAEEKRRAKMFFYEKSRIPNIIGCVDGTHIKIIKPNKQIRHHYYNRKGFYSLNAMIVCDHLMCIRYVNAKHAGASHDSNIWNMSPLKRKIEEDHNNGENYQILGDAGYPLTTYLLTPYRNTEEGSMEARFNKNHAKGRNIVERTIGLLKNRFRCTLRARELHYNPETGTKITNVCIALHNICIKYRVEDPEDQISEDETDNQNEDPNENDERQAVNDMNNEGSHIRNRIARFM